MVLHTVAPTTTDRQAQNVINPYDGKLAEGVVHELASFFPERPDGSSMEWPPGNLGELAKYIYCNSPMPIPEFSISTAIAFAAGIVGRGWGVNRTGLNHNIINVGRSTIGKNVVHDGITNLTNQLPAAASFIHHSECASGPALTNFTSSNPCSLQVIGECGAFWAAFGTSKHGDHIYQLVRQMLHLWGSSGPDGTNTGRNYAETSKNIPGGTLKSISYSSIGDTVGKTFYGALRKEEIWEQGLPSRLWIIEYDGDRPKLNEKPLLELPKPMLNYLTNLVQRAGLKTLEPQQPIHFTDEAVAWQRTFRENCDDSIDAAGDNEMERQIWGRAYQKVLRLAGICAVMDDFTNPIITLKQCVWTENAFDSTVVNLRRRIEDGSLSKDDDHKREEMVLARIHRWLDVQRDNEKDRALSHNRIVTRTFLQREVRGLAPFRDSRGGANHALNMTIQSLVDNGYLAEVPKDRAVKNYSFHGRCYQILNLPTL